MTIASAPRAIFNLQVRSDLGLGGPSERVRRVVERDEWAWLQTPVSEIMARKVIAVTPDLRIDQLIILLIDENISGLPVVDCEGRAIGNVSKTDLVAADYDWAEMREDARRLGREGSVLEELFKARTVADIMTSVAVTVPEMLPIPAAAAIMADSHAHRLPIVNGSDRVVGIISTLDIARWVGQAMVRP